MRNVLLMLSALAFLFAGTCKTKAPTSDSTPPSIEWVVTNKSTGNNEQTRINSTGTVNARVGDEYQVTMNVRDPQGVHKISLGGAGNYGCKQGDIGQSKILDEAANSQTLNIDAEGNVMNHAFMLRSLNFGGWTCQSGFTYAGGSQQLLGRGENFFGGVVNGTLTFTVGP